MIFTIALSMLAAAGSAGAQKLAIGERAPELQVGQWLGDSPEEGRARLIDFFHSSSQEAVSLLADMDAYAGKFAGRLSVIIVCREGADKVSGVVMKDTPKYHVALDDGGKTFASFDVRVVPFGVVTDSRGKVLWFGNPTQLDNDTLERLLTQGS